MESAVATLIIVTVLLFGALTMAHTFLSMQDELLQSWRAMEERVGERAATGLAVVRGEVVGMGEAVEVTLRNDGRVRLADYARWDVIVQHDAPAAQHLAWYPHADAAAPGEACWTVVGLYRDAALGAAEVFEPGILNPGEEIVIRISISPAVAAGSTAVAVVATPNGVSAATAIAHE